MFDARSLSNRHRKSWPRKLD